MSESIPSSAEQSMEPVIFAYQPDTPYQPQSVDPSLQRPMSVPPFAAPSMEPPNNQADGAQQPNSLINRLQASRSESKRILEERFGTYVDPATEAQVVLSLGGQPELLSGQSQRGQSASMGQSQTPGIQSVAGQFQTPQGSIAPSQVLHGSIAPQGSIAPSQALYGSIAPSQAPHGSQAPTLSAPCQTASFTPLYDHSILPSTASVGPNMNPVEPSQSLSRGDGPSLQSVPPNVTRVTYSVSEMGTQTSIAPNMDSRMRDESIEPAGPRCDGWDLG